jgi:hypothetical protein
MLVVFLDVVTDRAYPDLVALVSVLAVAVVFLVLYCHLLSEAQILA